MIVRIEGIGDLVAALERASARVPNAKQQFLAKEAEILRGRTMKNTPVDTGLLRGSWKQTQPSSDSVTVFNNVEYAAFVEAGHRQVVYGRYTGKFVQGRHMLKKGIDETKANFRQDGQAILNSIFSG